jgi:hypothetical protein
MGQVTPAGVLLLDHLACNCFLRRCEGFDVNEQVHAIFLDEFRASAAAVLFKPSSKVAGDANVERPVWPAGDDPLSIGTN